LKVLKFVYKSRFEFIGYMVLTHRTKKCVHCTKDLIKQYFAFWRTKIIVFSKADLFLKKIVFNAANSYRTKILPKTCLKPTKWINFRCVLDIFLVR
jgi:hypothetical protein